MHSSKVKKSRHSKKEKKLIKLIENNSDSDEDSEHELAYYINDRVKLMKEVLKIIKPKKIKSMAPECIRNSDNEEINSMLLEELLGISNKRLKYIFNGQNLEEDSSSTDTEEEKQTIDIISLDDVSDDDFVIEIDSGNSPSNKKHKKCKVEPKKKKIKKEKDDKKSSTVANNKTDEKNLMSVLELLELQARARAIRSQLVLETTNKTKEAEVTNIVKQESDNEGDVIIESPKNDEIVISSESDAEEADKENGLLENSEKVENNDKPEKEINIITNVLIIENGSSKNSLDSNSTKVEPTSESTIVVNEKMDDKEVENGTNPGPSEIMVDSEEIVGVDKETKVAIEQNSKDSAKHEKSPGKAQFDGDGIVINVDQSEIDCIISD